jgi:GLPGLI family protein
MKIYRIIVLSFLFINFSFSQEIEILYQVDIKRQFSQKALENFRKNKSKITADNEISMYQNPVPEFYSLKLNKNQLILEYVQNLEDESKASNLKVKNYPLGKVSFRIKNDSLIYYKFNFDKEIYFSSDTLIANKWVKTDVDSVILGFNVNKIKMKTEIAEYTAWYTDELPQNLGIGSLSYNGGFIIAFELSYYPKEPFKSHVIAVYPYKKRKLRKRNKFDFQTPKTLYTQNQIKDIFKERNKSLNKTRIIKN